MDVKHETNEAVPNEINEKRTMTNATTSIEINLNGHRLSVHRRHRGKENERTRGNPGAYSSLKKPSNERISPGINHSRRRQVTDVNGYNDKTRSLEAWNDDADDSIETRERLPMNWEWKIKSDHCVFYDRVCFTKYSRLKPRDSNVTILIADHLSGGRYYLLQSQNRVRYRIIFPSRSCCMLDEHETHTTDNTNAQHTPPPRVHRRPWGTCLTCD